MRLRKNMKVKLKALSEKIVGDQLLFLLLGMLLSISLNIGSPLFPSVIFLLISLTALFVIAILLALSRDFASLRILFLGASIVSVLFAFRTFFFSIALGGLIQIPFDALVGLFRSVLLTSFFSLLERLARFIEDQLETKTTEA
jgi:hypothetical protein